MHHYRRSVGMPASRKYDRDRVAAIVIEAISMGLPAQHTLAEVLDITHNQARYMIRAIRNDGLLGCNEHRPKRMVIHRNTPREKAWLACRECTQTWPCPEAFPYEGTHDLLRRRRRHVSTYRNKPTTTPG